MEIKNFLLSCAFVRLILSPDVRYNDYRPGIQDVWSFCDVRYAKESGDFVATRGVDSQKVN